MHSCDANVTRSAAQLQRKDIGSQVCQLIWCDKNASKVSSFGNQSLHDSRNMSMSDDSFLSSLASQDFDLLVAEGFSSLQVSIYRISPFLHEVSAFVPHTAHRPLQMALLPCSSVGSPHSDSPVTPTLLTCASDENLKFWNLQDILVHK
jgi:WD40 repeat protein